MLEKKGLLASSVIVEQATSDEQKVFCLDQLEAGYQPHYMSTIIIKNI